MRPRPTYANVTSTLALMIALGGTAYAGVTLGRGAVKGVNLARNSVTSPKVKDHSLLARDFARGELPAGTPGQGLQGPPGAAGSARAYATVTSSGALLAARSHGVTAVTKPAGAPVGSYCITLASGIDPASAVLVASADLGDPATSSKDYAQVDTSGADCGGKPEVVTRHLSLDTSTNPATIAAHRSNEGFTFVVP
jgi:hypothetical protein